MKAKMSKKLTALLVLVLIISLFTGLTAGAMDDTTYLAFVADVHYSTTYEQNNLDVWLGYLKDTVPSIEYLGLNGDLASAYSSGGGTFWECVQKVMDTADSYASKGFITKGSIYVLGNHEWYPDPGGAYAKNKDNEAAKKYMYYGEAAKTDKYIIYAFGSPATAENRKLDFAEDEINALSDYLKTAPTDIPIIIMSHFPLQNMGKPTSNADKVINVLNAYSNIIFLWAHNHNYQDPYYDNFAFAGDSIEVAPGNKLEIKFTYSSTGCMADKEYYGADHIKGKGVLMGIKGDEVTLTYYGIDGKPLEKTATVKIGSAAAAEKAAEVPALVINQVKLSSQSIKVNGETKAFEVYNIDGSNYFKLRDIAYVLNGTGSQFSVAYDESTKTLLCVTGEAYAANGSEMAAGADNSASAVVSSQLLKVNGKSAGIAAVNIGGSNFFKLRDLGSVLNFTVDYDEASKTVLITSASSLADAA
jgi:hypothetical protein